MFYVVVNVDILMCGCCVDGLDEIDSFETREEAEKYIKNNKPNPLADWHILAVRNFQ